MFKINGLYGHIQRNNFKSLAFLAGFILLLEVLEFALLLMYNSRSMLRRGGGNRPTDLADVILDAMGPHSVFAMGGWYYAMIIGVIWLVIGCAWNAHIIRFETKAHRVTRRDEPELYNIVENLSINAGLPLPRIEVIESPIMNAYASGLNPGTAVIAVTRGLIKRLNRDELEAVIAHELVHIRNSDIRLMVIAKTCMTLVAPIGQLFWDSVRAKKFKAPSIFILFAIIMSPQVALVAAAIIAWVSIIASGFNATIARSREFIADASAIELTKNPEALISALRRISTNDQLPDLSSSTQAMMFSGGSEDAFATHPSVEARIAAITTHASTLGIASPMRRPASPPTARPGDEPRAAFGRKRAATLPITTPTSPTVSPWARPASTGSSRVGSSSTSADQAKAAFVATPRMDHQQPYRADRAEPDEKPDPVTEWLMSGRADQMVKRVVTTATRRLVKVILCIMMLPAVLGVIISIIVIIAR
jgi:heat shock protein HtpX